MGPVTSNHSVHDDIIPYFKIYTGFSSLCKHCEPRNPKKVPYSTSVFLFSLVVFVS